MNRVLDAEPDPQAAFNLTLRTYALGDKKHIQQTLSKPLFAIRLCPYVSCFMMVQDAMQSMIVVLYAEPDHQEPFNLTMCTYALGDKEMMKQAFSRLVEVICIPLWVV